MAWYHLLWRKGLPRDPREKGHKAVQAFGSPKRFVRLQLRLLFDQHPNLTGAMELRVVKPSFKYTAGQWLFLQVPEISRWQWHPVSIVNYPPKWREG